MVPRGTATALTPRTCALLGMLQGRALDGLRALRKQPVNTKLLSETQVRGVGWTMA